MGIIIDIVIILFILASIYFGYKKGLISLGIHLVTFIVAIIITAILYRPIANVIIDKFGKDIMIRRIDDHHFEISSSGIFFDDNQLDHGENIGLVLFDDSYVNYEIKQLDYSWGLLWDSDYDFDYNHK